VGGRSLAHWQRTSSLLLGLSGDARGAMSDQRRRVEGVVDAP
jgi:hypothetical protein